MTSTIFKKGLLNDLKMLQRLVNNTSVLPNEPKITFEQLAKYAQQAACIETCIGKSTETDSSLKYLFGQLLIHLLHANQQSGFDFTETVQQAIESLTPLNTNKNGTTLQTRIIMVYDTYAELRVNGEVRGTIPVYDRCDQDELRNIAKLFHCELQFAASEQLGLFNATETLSQQVADNHIDYEISQLSLLLNFLDNKQTP